MISAFRSTVRPSNFVPVVLIPARERRKIIRLPGWPIPHFKPRFAGVEIALNLGAMTTRPFVRDAWILESGRRSLISKLKIASDSL
jgi:hypothetical protein